MLLYPCMLLFTMYVKDEYTAKKMEIAVKKLSKKMKTNTEMKWQSVRDGNKLVIACDFYKDDEEK
jgi:predicted GIY-YIG superfamily endonuclease